MDCTPLADGDAAARALALIVTANGRLDRKAMAVLERLQAFARVRVDRARFEEIAHACVRDVGAHLCECSWLCTNHLMYINARLDAVTDTQARLLICRLGLAAITADDQITADERLVYEHALARWHVDRAELDQASLRDPPGLSAHA